MNGRAQLARLSRALERGRPIPSDVAEWLLSGLEEFEQTGDLAGALRLQNCRQATQARDMHLRKAGEMMGDGVFATDKARRIKRTTERLAAYSDEPEAVPGIVGDTWRREVWLAMLNAPLPGYSRIRQIVADKV